MNRSTLIKRVSKMIEKDYFDCEDCCPKRLHYYKDPRFGILKGEEPSLNYTCEICRELFGLPREERVRGGCPCWQFGDDKEAVKAHVYKVLKSLKKNPRND